MVLGVAVGIALNPDTGWVGRGTALAMGEWIALPGHLFLGFIQMIVVPLILASIIRGVTAATDVQQLKSTGIWLGVYFLGAAVLALIIGISVGMAFKPGNYVDMAAVTQGGSPPGDALELPTESLPVPGGEGQEGSAIQEIPGQIVELLPTNPMGAIAEGDMLQIVIFAIVLGLGLLSLEPRSAKPLVDLFGSVQSVTMSVVGVAMTFAPVAVFGLLAQAMIKTGPRFWRGWGFTLGPSSLAWPCCRRPIWFWWRFWALAIPSGSLATSGNFPAGVFYQQLGGDHGGNGAHRRGEPAG